MAVLDNVESTLTRTTAGARARALSHTLTSAPAGSAASAHAPRSAAAAGRAEPHRESRRGPAEARLPLYLCT